MPQYFVNEKTGREYKIVAFDKATNKLKIQGQLSVFEEDYDKDSLKKLGYKIIQRDEPADFADTQE